MSRRNYANSASVGTISTSLNDTDITTSTTTTSALTSWPSTPCTAAINIGLADEEVVLVTAISGTNVTFTRGYDGTTTRAHSPNATLTHCSSAIDFDEANSHVNSSSGVHGITGSVVGTTDSQTLTNKTLTTPTILDFTSAQHDHSAASKGGTIPESSVTNLVSDLAAKAADANVLHLTGNETAAGNKTFSNNVTVTGNFEADGTLQRGSATVWATDNMAVGLVAATTDATSFSTFNHGLSWTPSKVFMQITAPNGGTNIGVPCVTAITSTQITCRLLLISGSTQNLTYNAYWLAIK